MSAEAKSEKQTQNNADDDLRAAFALLREYDSQGEAGKIESVRAKAFFSACLEASRRPAHAIHKRPKYQLAVALAGILIAVVLLGRGALERRGAETTRASQAVPNLRSTMISEWRAPSDVLLTTSDRELWRSVPQLGDSPTINWKDSTH
jgi:hypothetical protein